MTATGTPTRKPLRPLAQILDARRRGASPRAIEKRNARERDRAQAEAARDRSDGRLLVVALGFLVGFVVIAAQMVSLATMPPAEPETAGSRRADPIVSQRADIVDRNGALLATNIPTNALYARPQELIDPVRAARALARIFPDLDQDRLIRDFTGKRTFVWIKPKIAPEQMQQVLDIGEPGLLFGEREMRVYPNGALAAHVLGGAGFGREGVRSAEVVGRAGIEAVYDEVLRDPARAGEPLTLSLDLSAQAAVEQVLAGGMRLMSARGASAVLMDAQSGEILALASLPDFDPNERPRPPTSGDPSDSPLFNRAAQGVYELGSVFKPLTAAAALDAGLATPDTMIDTRGPLRQNGFKIKDFHDYGPRQSLTDVIVHSSNIGTARLAKELGGARQQAVLEQLGMFAPVPLEIMEARLSRPILPARWTELSTMTVAYGHGISVTPVHLAAAYAAIANGGYKVEPTLVRQTGAPARKQVFSHQTAAAVLSMLRQVVTRGTASMAEVPGYEVAGKTGTADKPDPKGGYYDDRTIATFAGIFPASSPKYVLVVTLDEPTVTVLGEARRTAGWTAVPVAAEIIARVAPILGLPPQVEPEPDYQLLLSRN